MNVMLNRSWYWVDWCKYLMAQKSEVDRCFLQPLFSIRVNAIGRFPLRPVLLLKSSCSPSFIKCVTKLIRSISRSMMTAIYLTSHQRLHEQTLHRTYRQVRIISQKLSHCRHNLMNYTELNCNQLAFTRKGFADVRVGWAQDDSCWGSAPVTK